MQLCIQAAMHYKQGSAYIDTENKLSLRRLHQMVEERLNILQQNHYSNRNLLYNDYSSLPILQNIRIQSPHSIDHLLHTLDQLEQTIITINHEHGQNNNNKQYPIRLLILDSIAAPLQREYNPSGPVESLTKRASVIFQIANKLKKMALLSNANMQLVPFNVEWRKQK